MQSKTYGDKQREAEQRKKQDELRKRSNPNTNKADKKTSSPGRPA